MFSFYFKEVELHLLRQQKNKLQISIEILHNRNLHLFFHRP